MIESCFFHVSGEIFAFVFRRVLASSFLPVCLRNTCPPYSLILKIWIATYSETSAVQLSGTQYKHSYNWINM